jgi:hypothetical protein
MIQPSLHDSWGGRKEGGGGGGGETVFLPPWPYDFTLSICAHICLHFCMCVCVCVCVCVRVCVVLLRVVPCLVRSKGVVGSRMLCKMYVKVFESYC